MMDNISDKKEFVQWEQVIASLEPLTDRIIMMNTKAYCTGSDILLVEANDDIPVWLATVKHKNRVEEAIFAVTGEKLKVTSVHLPD